MYTNIHVYRQICVRCFGGFGGFGGFGRGPPFWAQILPILADSHARSGFPGLFWDPFWPDPADSGPIWANLAGTDPDLALQPAKFGADRPLQSRFWAQIWPIVAVSAFL